MAESWAAERVVTAELATALIEQQFPEFAPARATPLGAGMDNTAYRVNDATVFRFPRRVFALQFLEAESRVMPALGPRLPVLVPVPVWFGQPSDAYPWPFLGYRFLPGRTACTATLTDSQRANLAAPLGGFLAALHAVPAEEAVRWSAPLDTIARLEVGRRVTQALIDIEVLVEREILARDTPLQHILLQARTDYAPRSDTLVHGDCYARHLLVDEGGALAGVIDWGDVHRGDPASDLMVAYAFLPPAAHDVFRHAYGEIDERTWEVARLRAVWHTLKVLLFADGIGDADLTREGQAAVRFLGAG